MNVGLLLIGTSCSVVVAPVAAIAWVCRLRGSVPNIALSSWSAPLVAIVWRSFALASTVATVVMALVLTSGTTSASPAGVAAAYACLASAALALAAWGAFCACCFADPLDAAGCALTSACVLGFGILVAGPVASAAPTVVVNAALAASPLVATASAASVDLLRMDLLYRLSPIAHTRFDYPAWSASVTLFVVLAAAGFAAVGVSLIRLGRQAPAERI